MVLALYMSGLQSYYINYLLKLLVMVKTIIACIVWIFCFHSGISQEANISDLKEVKPGSVFLKPGLGGFFKLGRIDDELSPEMEDLAKKLKSGFVWSVDGGVMISSSSYIGATFSRTNQSGSFRNFIFQPGGSIVFNIDNTETIQYFGAYYGHMQALNSRKSIFWHSRAGIGFWNYQCQFSAEGTEAIEFKESNIGFQLGTGLEFRLANVVSWVIDVDLLSGNVKIEDEKENLSQIRATTGLLFRF
jgi:hypothetical protein